MSSLHTTIDLVRHGEVQTPGLFCARPDEPLSRTGHTQLAALENSAQWSHIVSSPQRRCREFAERLSKHQCLPLDISPQWREMNFGTWVGRAYQDIWDNHQAQLLALWERPLDFTAPQGDRMQDFIARTSNAWQTLLEQHQGKHILVITHAGVIRSILAQALKIDYQSAQKFNVAHGKINRIRSWPDGEISLLNWACPPQALKHNLA